MITTVPADTPVTTPVADPTVASGGMLLYQKPPPVASVRLVVLPTQTVSEPEILAGAASTVTTAVVIQPVGNV